MGKYIVMDIVFKAASLNYDQGSGNYQELKKITRWNGKQHTFVSRYALRYSLLENAKETGIWKIDEGNVLTTETGKAGREGSIQPKWEALFSGEILNYPEFDLFGYLITSTSPQNFRTAPVKISHAISMTPFNYDALFNANIGMANRLRKLHGGMTPNPFTSEEHETYYIYSVVIDIDNVGKTEAYLSKEDISISKNENEYIFGIGTGKNKKEFRTQKREYISEIMIPLKEGDLKGDAKEDLSDTINFKEGLGAFMIKYVLQDNEISERIVELIKLILNLKRNIKGRSEDLSPKLIVLGLYENTPYKSFKDRIALVDEDIEETHDEIIEETEEEKKIVKVIHKTVKETRPKFRIHGLDNEKTNILTEDKIVDKVKKFLEKTNEPFESVEAFALPEICVEIKNR